MQSQEIPPIQIFTPQDYEAENQNWGISQGSDDFIYIANNSGLIEYTGASWRLYSSPNGEILRSIRVVDNHIYSGGYMDFGYWKKNRFGKLNYKSLIEGRTFSVKEDEEFWGILDIEGYIIFQSFDRIYIYNTEEDNFSIIESDVRIDKVFKVNETVYFHIIGRGIYKIQNGKDLLVIPSKKFNDCQIINVYGLNDGLLLQTKSNGFFRSQNNKVSRWNISADEELANLGVYSSIRLNDGSFLLGTISKGIIQLDKNGNILLRINQADGLSNNTILSIFEDKKGNVWLGLDNGINVVNLKSPFRVYKDKLGILGTIYTSAKANGNLYLGTNQGLFYKPINSSSQFKFVNGTKGQVWCLLVYDNTLFCGHDNGTFIIEQDKAQNISSEIGTWTIGKIAEKPDLLIQGNYKGINILKKENGKWSFRNKIEGFDISSRYLEFSNPKEILVSHEYKGVYKIEIDNEFKRVLNYNKIPADQGVKSSIIKYNDSILYSYKQGVFKYDAKNKVLKKDSLLSVVLGGENYLSGKLIFDKTNNRLWGFPKNEIFYVEPGKLTNKPEINRIPISSGIRKSAPGYENILQLDGNRYVIGTTEGYLIMDLDGLEQSSNDINLNSVGYNSRQNELVSLAIDEASDLDNRSNSMLFKFSVANYNKLSTPKYQYRLFGIYNNWSDWSEESESFFENLPHGDYTFEARAMTDGVLSNNVITYNFSIAKPWYIKPLAVGFYVFFGLLLAYLVHYFNKRHYKKQKEELLNKKQRELELEQLENQRQLIQFKNKNLRLDIENKNRELGIATMNLVKRNELLNNIKEELTKSKTATEVKSVVKLINSSLNSTGDWKLFEEAFNNVDKDFMKRIKTLHPAITPNDLRLCAYLRLNLSSKEIAPLLNISHKSVEVKRYRLRKKMGLDHDQSLSNYIIEL